MVRAGRPGPSLRKGAKIFKKGAKGGNLRPKRGHLEKQNFIRKSNDILQI
jgi:hypothetical protein